VGKAVALHKKTLFTSLVRHTASLDETANRKFMEILHRAHVSAVFTDGVMTVDSDVDLCRVGLAPVLEDSEEELGLGNRFRLSEHFAIETIAEFFEARPEAAYRTEFLARSDDLDKVAELLETTTTVKGNLFELVVRVALWAQAHGSPKVVDLPLLKGHSDDRSKSVRSALEASDSAWRDVKFTCTGILPPGERAKYENAAAVLAAHPTEMYMPEISHRVDLLLALGSAFLLACCMKLYSRAVPTAAVRSQYRATVPGCAYERADAYKDPALPMKDRLNPAASAARTAWEAGCFHERKALRVHVSLPRAAVPKMTKGSPHNVPAREYEPGLFLGEDGSIVVNVDATNFHVVIGLGRDADVMGRRGELPRC
jgi:hypothetical protein